MDAPHSFEQPFILLDTTALDSCDRDQVLDVYCGLGAHECGHILSTRDGIRRGKQPELLAIYLNLLEDIRIEELIRQDAPGYGQFLEFARQALIVRPSRVKADLWDHLPDMDRLLFLIFSFIRCPEEITDSMRDWQPPLKDVPFKTLRALLPSQPESESDVKRIANGLFELWKSLRRKYPQSPAAFVNQRASRKLSDRNAPAVLIQLEADARDRAAQKRLDADDEEAAVDQFLQEAAEFERCAGLATGEDAVALQAIAERLLEHGERIEEAGVWSDEAPRFSTKDLKKVVASTESIEGRLSDTEWHAVHADTARSESVEAEDLPVGHVEFGDAWEWGTDRKTLIEFPSATEASRRHIAEVRRNVAGHSAALRNVLRLPTEETSVMLRDRRRGRIDRRRLWRGAFDDRLFYETETVPEHGLALCLLIDESGSMWRGEPKTKIDVACEVAVMIAQAADGLPQLEIEAYSYTSDAQTDDHCAVRYLYGRRNRSFDTLAEWSEGVQNYDHQAIVTATRLFQQNTTHGNRWMIVLSDGAPEGNGYGGEPAIEATRNAVQATRRQGIPVINVAIEDYDSERIFGERNVLKWTNHAELVAKMRRLVTTLAR